MELIVISDSRLKVVLTRVDMETYHLDFDEESCDSARTRRAMMRLFEDVKRRSGFDITDDRILVQIWQGADGGCELYVSKLEHKKALHSDGTPTVEQCKRQMYAFHRLNDLLSVCRTLFVRAYDRPSDVYYGEGGEWYLVLEGEDSGNLPSDLSFIEEYAKKHGSAPSFYTLAEHAKLIAGGDAVCRMAALA